MVAGTQRFPLLTTGGQLINTGGHQDPSRAGLSRMDIERVRALYTPIHIPPQHVLRATPVQGSLAASITNSEHPWLSVEVAGMLSTIVGPVPTQSPISANSSEALELGKKYAVDIQCAHSAPSALLVAPAPFRPLGTLGRQITKRWYSVPLDQDAPPEAKRAWPACKDGTRTINYFLKTQPRTKNSLSSSGKL